MLTTARPSSSAAKSIPRAILADLKAAFPEPVATADLIARHGVGVKSRVQELDSKDGEDVEAVTCPTGAPATDSGPSTGRRSAPSPPGASSASTTGKG